MARSIVKRIAQLFTPEDISDFTDRLPNIVRGSMAGERMTGGIKGERKGADVIDYEAPDAHKYLEAYHKSLASPAYRSLPKQKQKAFRSQAEGDLTRYKDII